MNRKTSTLRPKTLTIQSAPKNPAFTLLVGNVSYGIIKQHNVIKITSHDAKINLTLSVLTKITDVTLRLTTDDQITVKWNKIKGQFQIVDKKEIIISQKAYLSKFSKIFYPLVIGFFLLFVAVVLLLILV